jgi:hypothetical protein
LRNGAFFCIPLDPPLGYPKNRRKMAMKVNAWSSQFILKIVFPFPKKKAFLSLASLETQRSQREEEEPRTRCKAQGKGKWESET